MFAAVVGHCSSRATPSLRYAPPRQSMEIVRGETIYRNRNAVQSNPATSIRASRSPPPRLRGTKPALPTSIPYAGCDGSSPRMTNRAAYSDQRSWKKWPFVEVGQCGRNPPKAAACRPLGHLTQSGRELLPSLPESPLWFGTPMGLICTLGGASRQREWTRRPWPNRATIAQRYLILPACAKSWRASRTRRRTPPCGRSSPQSCR